MQRGMIRALATLAAASGLVLAVALAPQATAATTFDPANNMAKTPPMGWNSYNIFGGTFFSEEADCSLPGCIPLNEARIKQIAESMIATGLRDKGYKYINIDDRWQDPRQPRGADGRLRWDPRRFPNGIPSLATWLHDRGLKLGLYVLPNDRPCGGEEGPTNKPGWPSGLPETSSMGHEQVDAQTFADWQVDYLKFDWCGVTESKRNGKAAQVFNQWDQAIQATGRNMLVAASTWGWEKENTWGPSYAHTWRIDSDVYPEWSDIMRTLDKGSTAALRAASGPTKGWNDFDTMQVGNRGLNDAENRTHFIMWAMANSPLMLGNDLRNMTPAILDLVSNDEIIAVNQDSKGEQAWLADNSSDRQVWARSLADGSKAVALVNRTGTTQMVTADFGKVFLGSRAGVVRDLLEHKDKGLFADSYSVAVAPHDTVILKIAPAAKAEIESATLTGGARIQDCQDCSGYKNVGSIGNNAGVAQLSVAAPKSGLYDLKLFYNSGESRSLKVSVNGGAAINLDGLNSGSWSSIGVKGFTANLSAGTNTLKFFGAAGQWAPDLDAIALAPSVGAARVEAESGALAGGASVQACSACSGGKNVGSIGNNQGRLTLEASVPNAGTYKAVLYYNSGDTRKVYVAVNSGAGSWLQSLNSGSWSAIGSVEFNLTLQAGLNTIEFSAPQSGVWAPDLDRLDLELIG